MPAIQYPNLLIKPLFPEEILQAQHFIAQHADWVFTFSLSGLLHNASTIFVCLNADNEWLGIIVSYPSNTAYSTAIIEGVVVHRQKRRQGIGSYLLTATLEYWKKECIFNICCVLSELSEAIEKLLIGTGFKPIINKGFIEYRKRFLPEKISVHNRRMRPSMNTINGEVSEETLFEYFQKDDIVWGTYGGGEVIRGVLLGRMARNGDITFQYMQHSKDGDIHTGISQSSTEFLNDGRIILYEDWEWTGNRGGGGRSVIEEIKPDCF